jgi:hypothetical protein
VVHFACHGLAVIDDPLDSGLLLSRTDRLTLCDLLGLTIIAGLAVLSACETALTGTDLPDEAQDLWAACSKASVKSLVRLGLSVRYPGVPQCRDQPVWTSTALPHSRTGSREYLGSDRGRTAGPDRHDQHVHRSLRWERCHVGGLGREVVGRVDEGAGVGYHLDAAEVVGHPMPSRCANSSRQPGISDHFMLDRMARIDVTRNHAWMVAGRCALANGVLDARTTTSSPALRAADLVGVVVMGRRETEGSSACLNLGLRFRPVQTATAVPQRWTMAAEGRAQGAGSHAETHAISLGG